MSSFQDLVLRQLQCKACFKYMQSPIRLCAKGHSSCDTCARKYTTCTVCHYPFLTTRNQALEELANEIDLKCDNCDFTSNFFQMDRHTENCCGEKQIYKCTKEIRQENYLKKTCTWSGCTDEIFHHFKEFHEKSLYSVSLGTKSKFHWKLPYRQDQIDLNVIHTKNGNFLHVVFYDDSNQTVSFAVINIETDIEKFRFEIHINDEEDRQIYKRKIDEKYMTIKEMIDLKRCIQIPLTNFKYFNDKERDLYWSLIINKD